MGFFDWLTGRKRIPRDQPEASIVVEFDETEVRCTRPNGNIERVRWDDLNGILLRNTDSGPFAPDVFWILVGSEGGCVIPQGATGEENLLERLQQLPGFNSEAVIASATCTGNQDFLCWERKSS